MRADRLCRGERHFNLPRLFGSSLGDRWIVSNQRPLPDLNIAKAFAEQASTVLSNALAYSTSAQLTGQLREALETRQLIGEATGILMERLGCSREAAFDHLRQNSNNTNVKLKNVARGVAESVQQPP
jgi:AmiR/NasT family two-component response regulator